MTVDESYALKYTDNGVIIHPATCLQPWKCECKFLQNKSVKCCYSAEEIKEKVADYYKETADYIQRQSLKDFLHDQGIYSD